MTLPSAVLSDTRLLWDYHRLCEPFSAVDVIVGLGSYDPGVAEYCADLLNSEHAPWLVFTGGVVQRSDLLRTRWTEPEAEVFRKIAVERGAPSARILLETKSTNTGENLRFSRALLEQHNIAFDRILIVTKPNMERRARATAAIALLDKSFSVTSPPCGFEEYVLERFDTDMLVNLMVGDLQRMAVYGRSGLQAPETIPPEVRAAFNRLVQAGYSRHLVPGTTEL